MVLTHGKLDLMLLILFDYLKQNTVNQIMTMDYFLGYIPFTQIIVYLVVGLSMLLIFNFIGRYIIPLTKEKIPSVNLWWQKIQIISWLVYSVLFFASLLTTYTAMTLIVTIIVLGLSWEYWRNIFSGVLIKFGNQFNEGDFISTDFVKGTIKTIYLSRSELINEKGELVIVPNHKLRNGVVTQLHKTHDVNICIFNVRTTNDQPLENIYQLAYNCPYISANQEISVEKKQTNNYVIKATIIDNSFTENANNYFENSIYFKTASKSQD